MAVSSCNKAAKVIDGIRERYNTSILYEESTLKRTARISLSCTSASPCLHHPHHRRTAEGTPQALSAGRCQQHPFPMASEESSPAMTKFLQLRKEHKLQEFSQSHRKIFNTFHLPMWKRIFDILFAVAVLIVLSPILIATAIAIRVESKGRVIYKSQRVGSNYQIFNFLVPLHVHQCRQAPERAERPQPI